MFKKIVIYVLISCLFMSFSIDQVFASSNENHVNNSQIDFDLVNQRVIEVLNKNSIEYTINDGNKIVLLNSSSEVIENVNNLVEESFYNEVESQENNNSKISTFAASYPTNWIYMPTYNIYNSTKITKTGEVALAATLSYWLINYTNIHNKLARTVAAAAGTYFFVSSSTTAYAYYSAKHAWRELGPGSFSPTNGQFMGEYQMMKYEKVTNAAGDIVANDTRYANSTVIEPIF